MEYAVSEVWEHSGYSDSDWYQVVYDTETGELSRAEVHTTRFYSEGRTFPAAEGEVLEAARRKLVEIIMVSIWDCWYNPVPEDLAAGDEVVIARGLTAGAREICPKCGGNGKWVNPKRAIDQRECFTCNGLGFGRPSNQKDKITAGSIGTIIRAGKETDRAGKVTEWYLVRVGESVYRLGKVYRAGLADVVEVSARIRERVLKLVRGDSGAFYLAFRTMHKDKRLAEYMGISSRKIILKAILDKSEE